MTARELAAAYECDIADLKRFTEEYLHQIEEARYELDAEARAESTAVDAAAAEQAEQMEEPLEEGQLAGFWITSKSARIERYQAVADELLKAIAHGKGDATTLREARSYMMYVANELGQLPLRGAKTDDGSEVSYMINGVDVEMMK